ncbi:hypothetical protein PPL_09588 [Heterostelium album PN500]|uniref:HP domain-containing protein n=1 Tax=Heterostelium pallidum (strain ATCC 26659 / Pp 5 / PN500) TaxID=670386 RepID=D3BNR7_HETP5|nr:hypothetical protein PPL_09588 [Heterostelium album PN500]EFA76836.1 hypothetical protein PPL_09588 [Heterostelium album PN500]|eukprot:XP_020428968.1 hypothetical protein PPL_09588 [Heterostelium album PN500]
MGGMAALAAEAQKKKLEKDNNKNNAALNRLKVEEPEAPVFVKGRSQSVSVTSTLKGDTTGKFLVHKKVVDTYSGLRTRLIHCKGKKRILTREVEVTTRSLNKTDTFVLDCGIEGSGVGGESSDSSAHTNIYVWYGSKSNAAKKSKAVAIAEIIKSHERGGHATIIKLDESDRDADATEFYRRMHGKADDYIMPDGGDDMEAEQTWPQSFNLLKYNQDNGQLISVDSKALSMELLASDSFFVLDTGSEYYAWSGRNADIPAYKDKFLEKAKERLTGNNQRPAWVEMIVTSEGGEPVMFREKYFDWPDLSHEVSLSRMGFGKKRVFDVSIPYEKKSPLKMSQFDVQEMIYSEPPEEAPHRSDGTGTYEMWYVDNMKILPIPEEEYGHFYSGNCYLIRYTYTRWNALKYIIYIWQGADATRQDVGSSSLLSKDIRDIFVLTDSNTTYMWEGSGASKVLKEQAAKLATLIVNSPSKSAATIQEGQEPEEFWKMLGGKAKYANDQLLKHPKSVKLFAIVNTGTIIRSDEVFNFNQYELQANRVFILDNKVKMYVWSGSRATEKEKKRGMEIAIEYIKLLNDGRAEEDNANGADTEESPKVESASTLLKKYYQTLPLEMLTQKNTPPEIDRSVLEMYLSDEEFQKVLGMQKTEWEVLPGWKKSERKKSVGLF